MSASKKQKLPEAKEYFPGQPAIEYKGSDSIDPMAFKYYNAEEVVAGKKMKDWLRFAVCWWHTWKGNGADIFGLDGSYERPWSCLLYTSPSPRDHPRSRMPSSA